MASRYITVGREVDGDPARLAPIPADWWRLFARVVKLRMGLSLEIIQAKGNYEGSGGTHSDGWAIDLRTWRFNRRQINGIVGLARTYGASATWYRTKVGSGPHIHLVVDSGEMWTCSQYQTKAVRAGFNGLGAGGKSGLDTHPAPKRWITGQAGISKMQTYLQGHEMTPAQEKKLDRAIALMSTVNRKLDRLPAEVWGRKWDDYGKKEKSTASDALFTIQQLARAIAKKVGA